MATRKAAPSRRPRNGGGLYTKTRTRRDPHTGRTYAVTYWEASWDIPEDRRQAGFARKRITGSGPTQSIALRNLEHNKEAFLAGRGRGRENVKGIPKGVMPTVAQLFDAWIDEIEKGAVSDIVAGKYRGYTVSLVWFSATKQQTPSSFSKHFTSRSRVARRISRLHALRRCQQASSFRGPCS